MKKAIKSKNQLLVESLIRQIPAPVCKPIVSKKYKKDKYIKKLEDY